MSLTLALRSALSGLQYNQTALQVTSNNIANVNTDGYSRKSVRALTQLVAGVGAGVLPSGISRTVDYNLLRDMRTQQAALGQFRVADEFLTRTQDLFGSPESSTSLTSNLATLGQRMDALATAPEDVAKRRQVIDAATMLTRQLNDMAGTLQSLRTTADANITDSVKTINTELAKIEALNNDISRNKASSLPTADLEDQRDNAINKIAEQIDITYFFRDTGEVVIQTAAGGTLVDGPASTLTHTSSGALSAGVTYPGGIDGIALNGVDITTTLRSGRLKGLIDMRDKTLVDINSQIDELALQIRDSVNAVHNDGSSVPPANTLTGTLTVAGADPFAGTGKVRIAVVDANGNAVTDPFELDLTTVSTVTDVVNAISAGLGSAASVSVTANGVLEIKATNATNGIAINELDSKVTADGRGFSHHFGLNDFFVGSATPSLASQIAVRTDLVANPQLVSRGELNPGPFGPGDNAVAAGDNTVVQRIADVLNGTASFSAAGGFPALTVSFADYSGQILGANASDSASAADTVAFREKLAQDLTFRVSSVSGVNVDEELANLTVLQNAYAASARVVSVISNMMDTLNQVAR